MARREPSVQYKETMRHPIENLSMFFPAYNDAGSIAEVVKSYYVEASRFSSNLEVVVVNDGSMDATGEILDALALEMPALRVVHHPHNMGYGAALTTGFRNCRHDLLFYTDGDGQYRASDLAALFEALDEDTDIVNGYKRSRGDGWGRAFTGILYKSVTRMLFGIRIRDIDCDYRLIRRRAFYGIELRSRTGVICTEMVYKWERKGCRIKEVPVSHHPRIHGRSQFFTFRHLKNAAFGLIGLWFNVRVRGR